MLWVCRKPMPCTETSSGLRMPRPNQGPCRTTSASTASQMPRRKLSARGRRKSRVYSLAASANASSGDGDSARQRITPANRSGDRPTMGEQEYPEADGECEPCGAGTAEQYGEGRGQGAGDAKDAPTERLAAVGGVQCHQGHHGVGLGGGDGVVDSAEAVQATLWRGVEEEADGRCRGDEATCHGEPSSDPGQDIAAPYAVRPGDHEGAQHQRPDAQSQRLEHVGVVGPEARQDQVGEQHCGARGKPLRAYGLPQRRSAEDENREEVGDPRATLGSGAVSTATNATRMSRSATRARSMGRPITVSAGCVRRRAVARPSRGTTRCPRSRATRPGRSGPCGASVRCARRPRPVPAWTTCS